MKLKLLIMVIAIVFLTNVVYSEDSPKSLFELLTNLDKVPEYGAIAVVTFAKPEKGSGFPARVFAIIP